MALHVCSLCVWRNRNHQYRCFEYGESTLKFENGHVWTFPNLILHYIQDHKWLPPEDFVNDVMKNNLSFFHIRDQERVHNRIGYLTEVDLETSDIPEGFVDKLKNLIEQSNQFVEVLKYYGPGDK